jgi:hypothetical protein
MYLNIAQRSTKRNTKLKVFCILCQVHIRPNMLSKVNGLDKLYISAIALISCGTICEIQAIASCVAA